MTTTVVLFAPVEVVSRLRLTEFSSQWGQGIGLAFLVSSGLLLATIGGSSAAGIRRWYAKNRLKSAARQRMRSLDVNECAVVREFFLRGQNTVRMPIHDSTVSGLLAVGVLKVVGNSGVMSVDGPMYPLALTAAAKGIATLEMLGFPVEDASVERVTEVVGDRPAFVDSPDFSRMLRG